MNYEAKIKKYIKQNELPEKYGTLVLHFFHSYVEAMQNAGKDEFYLPMFGTFIELIREQTINPHSFEPYHTRTTEPFDHYQFGLDFFKPLIIFSTSKILGHSHVDQMEKQMEKGENVILLANHQTEIEPQVIHLLLQDTHPHIAKEMVFVAGQRVISDPLAVPFSLGCNLLCIHSKKYLEIPPEQKPQKLLHNQKTMKKMQQLLSEGGKCIYVAPSGGRDRYDDNGNAIVSQFDSSSIEMFYLMSQQSEKRTHFYPLALATSRILPAPSSVETDLGEQRKTRCTPAHMAFGSEIDMERIPLTQTKDRKVMRKQRADYIWKLVCDLYDQISFR